MFCRKADFGPKIRFPKTKTDIYLGEEYFFLCTSLPGRGENMVSMKKCSFLGPKIRISALNSVFCYRTPDFVDGPFVALGKMVDFASSDLFWTFLF